MGGGGGRGNKAGSGAQKLVLESIIQEAIIKSAMGRIYFFFQENYVLYDCTEPQTTNEEFP